MPAMSDAAAISAVRELLEVREMDRERLDLIHLYFRGRQPHPLAPRGAAVDVKKLARISRVNMMKLVVSSMSQALYVDGFRQRLADDDAPVWETWQLNKFDSRHLGVHRSALAYGLSYVTVLPGDEAPKLKGFSPLNMTALYGDDDDWPDLALRSDPSGAGFLHRLYDEERVYFVSEERAEQGTSIDNLKLEVISSDPHGLAVTPVVRFLNEQDLDEDNDGEVEPLMELQDQIDLTTFGLLVAQHFAAFRQRYIIGWTADDEESLLKASAARILTFDDSKDEIEIGEFGQTELDGYLKSREESLKQIASISQTPVHELIGSLVNLSAEALVAAEAGQRRKVTERQTSFGEAWEQVFELAAVLEGTEIDTGSQVRWRDTESRAFGATIDGLGKIATMLNVPPEELWERIPNITQHDIEVWKAKAKEAQPLDKLNATLERMIKTGEDPNADAGGAAA